jgi:predicted nucleic acid-binding Zn ribbon protein
VTAHRRSPRPLAIALGRIEAELAPQTVLAQVQRRWPEVVGESVAAQATPTSERAGVLTVSCAASVWAQELDLMSQAIIKRLNAVLDDGQIARLRCVTVPLSEPS